jgi:hypothetical protein
MTIEISRRLPIDYPVPLKFPIVQNPSHLPIYPWPCCWVLLSQPTSRALELPQRCPAPVFGGLEMTEQKKAQPAEMMDFTKKKGI